MKSFRLSSKENDGQRDEFSLVTSFPGLIAHIESSPSRYIGISTNSIPRVPAKKANVIEYLRQTFSGDGRDGGIVVEHKRVSREEFNDSGTMHYVRVLLRDKRSGDGYLESADVVYRT